MICQLHFGHQVTELTVDFGNEAATGIECFIDLGKDPAGQGIVTWKATSIEVFFIPIVGGVENEPGKSVPFIRSEFPENHGSS